MQATDFEVGETYVVTTKDWDAPDGSGTVPGKVTTVKVLPALEWGEAQAFDGVEQRLASTVEVAARKSFVRVRHDDGRVRLLNPDNIAAVSLIRRYRSRRTGGIG